MGEWLLIAVFGILSGTAASLGIGGGAILIIFLTLILDVQQLSAQGINLIFFIPIALFSAIIYCKNKLINIKKATFIAAFGIIGALIGTYLSGVIDENILSKIFGGILILISLKGLFAKKKAK